MGVLSIMASRELRKIRSGSLCKGPSAAIGLMVFIFLNDSGPVSGLFFLKRMPSSMSSDHCKIVSNSYTQKMTLKSDVKCRLTSWNRVKRLTVWNQREEVSEGVQEIKNNVASLYSTLLPVLFVHEGGVLFDVFDAYRLMLDGWWCFLVVPGVCVVIFELGLASVVSNHHRIQGRLMIYQVHPPVQQILSNIRRYVLFSIDRHCLGAFFIIKILAYLLQKPSIFLINFMVCILCLHIN